MAEKPFAPEALRQLSDADLRERLRRPVAHPAIYRSVHDEIARRETLALEDEKRRREAREIEAHGFASQQVDIGWSADRKSTWAIRLSVGALVIAALDALCNLAKS